MAKILFLGDFFYNYDYYADDIADISKFIKKNNYLCILNLEGSLASSNKKIIKRGPNLFQSDSTVEILKELNVIGVCLSNNHIMDYGKKGLDKTLKILDKNNIKHCGAGKNLKSSLKPMIFDIDNKKVVIYNYGWNVEETVYSSMNECGCSPKELKFLNLHENKEKDSVVIDVFHWGFEYNLYPMPLDIKIAHKMIDSGSDLIIGHHPHVVQPREIYSNRKIYYSLGNFYFSGRRENFLRKKFKGNINDRCSYGLGVLFDTNTTETEEILFYYDSKIKKTFLINDSYLLDNILDDISDVKYNSFKYKKQINLTKLNYNPILTGNCFFDFLKIKILYMFYFFKKIIKKIRGTK